MRPGIINSHFLRCNKLFVFILFSALTFIIPSCQKFDYWNHHGKPSNGKGADAQVALDWYHMQLRLLLERNSTMNGVYFAYLGIGLYEAVQPGSKHAVSLSTKLYQMPAMPSIENGKKYNWEVSANAALAALLRSYNSGLTAANIASIDSLENVYNERLKPSAGESFTRSQEFGKNIAAAVHNWSLTDKFNPSNAGYVAPDFDGAWIPTPPAFVNPPVLPFVSSARPLLASLHDQVTEPFPFAYSEQTTSDFYKMVKNLYDVSKTLTDEQKNIALFWVDQGNGVGFTPPGHDFSIITQALYLKGSDLFTTAEVYAKTGIAERESTIICFRSKHKYSLIRPVSYIQEFIEPGWMPFIGTPPHPEYPAAHALITGAVMESAERVLGRFSFTDHTYDFRGLSPRTYKNLFASGEEAGQSRLYGGIHYQTSIDIGLKVGNELGSQIGKLNLHY